MNIYGIITGTNDYTLNISMPPGFRLQVGDTITIRPQNTNTGASTLSIGGDDPLPLTLNGSALVAGDIASNVDRQCTFIGSGFALDDAPLSASDILAAVAGVAINLGSAGGTANALTATSTDGATSPATGRLYRIRPSAGNTGAATLAINGGSAIQLRKNASAALASGDLVTNRDLLLYYDGTYYQVLAGRSLASNDIPSTLLATTVQSPQVQVLDTAWVTLRTLIAPCVVEVITSFGYGAGLIFFDGSEISFMAQSGTGLEIASSASSGKIALRMSGANLQASNNTVDVEALYAGLVRR